MQKSAAPVCRILVISAIVTAAIGFVCSAAWASPQSAAVALASHRAVYDLKLASTRGKQSIQSVRGRILYDFAGSACEGYSLQFRQVSELHNGEGKSVVSDLRATSWEGGTAKRLRFHSQNYLNQVEREVIDGQAERTDNGISVRLTKPAEKSFQLTNNLVFPTEHVRGIIAAARTGKPLLQTVVYDGSDNGQKLFDTLTVIGKPIAPKQPAPTDALAGLEAFIKLTRWPVTISYFDRAAGEKTGEQTPVYSVALELYENGVSRALTLDYGNFVLSGEMTSFEMKDTKPCP